MPLMTFLYLYQLVQKMPSLFQYYTAKALWAGALIIAINILVGLTGVGYSTYGSNQNGLGTTGFIYGGNELGGLLIVIYCFVLHYVWCVKRAWYLPVGLLCLFLSLAVATKTAALAGLLSTALIPFVNERGNLLKLTKLKLSLIFIIAAIAIFAAFYLVDLFLQSDLYARVSWAYNNFGLLGFIFSGRQDFVAYHLQLYTRQDSILTLLFGLGVGGVADTTTKYSAEVDPIDVLVWFGIVGFIIVFSMAMYFLVSSFRKLHDSGYFYAPAVFLSNLLLFVTACFSGHIWTSGMLGISWALLNSLMLKRKQPLN